LQKDAIAALVNGILSARKKAFAEGIIGPHGLRRLEETGTAVPADHRYLKDPFSWLQR
jgi:hypothetical protein